MMLSFAHLVTSVSVEVIFNGDDYVTQVDPTISEYLLTFSVTFNKKMKGFNF